MTGRFWMAVVCLLPFTASAHNLLWGDFRDLTNSTINIKQASPHNEMYGSGSGQDFEISGDDITVDIDQVQTGAISYIKGNFECDHCSYKGLIEGSNSGSTIQTTYLHTSSSYHHLDVHIAGSGGSNSVIITDAAHDHSNTSVEVDIVGGSSNVVRNRVYGTRQTMKTYIDGSSNTVRLQNQGTGSYATGQTSIADYSDISEYNNYLKIVGSSNTVGMQVVNGGLSNITIAGDSNSICKYGATCSNASLIGVLYGEMTIDINGDSNIIGVYSITTGDKIELDLDGDGHTVKFHQEGTTNYAGIKIYGEGLYKVTYDLKQRGNDTHNGCINIADLSANTTYTYDTTNTTHRNVTNHTASATGCLTSS